MATDIDKALEEAKALAGLKIEGDSLIIPEEIELKLAKIKQLEGFVKQAMEVVKERIKELAAESPKLKKYEGKFLNIGYIRKSSLVVVDSSVADPKYTKIKYMPQTDKIKLYKKATGKLPDGIGEKVSEYPTFTLLKTDENEE